MQKVGTTTNKSVKIKARWVNLKDTVKNYKQVKLLDEKEDKGFHEYS